MTEVCSVCGGPEVYYRCATCGALLCPGCRTDGGTRVERRGGDDKPQTYCVDYCPRHAKGRPT